jgi:hypothetical protein
VEERRQQNRTRKTARGLILGESKAAMKQSGGKTKIFANFLAHCSPVFFNSRIRFLIVSLGLVLIAECLSLTAYAQMGVPKGGSPLYNSRPYSPSAPNGLPKALDDVGIDQKLNEQLPLDLVFRDESGRNVRLNDYFDKKPVVLALVYYQCPMLCNQVLNGIVGAFRVMSFAPGQEFDVVYGIEYAPRDLRLGLIEASQNKIGSPVDQLILYCYHYDPATGRYGAAVMNMIRVGGIATLIVLGALLVLLRRRRRIQIDCPARNAT